MKKNVLSLIVCFGLCLTTTMSALAQNKHPRGGFHLAKELNLTDEQKSRLQELKNDFRAKLVEIKSDTLLGKDEAEAKMKALGEQYKADSKSVLTAEQVAKVKSLIGDKPIGTMARGMKALDLTNEQKDEMKTLNSRFKSKKDSLNTLPLSKADKRSKLMELGKEHRASIDNILTPEQQAKMKDVRQHARKEIGNKRPQQWKHRGQLAHIPNRDFFAGLNLTDNQKQKIKTLTEEFRAKNRELADQRLAAINEVLTPEQQLKVKERQEKISKRDKKDRPRSEVNKERKSKDKV